MSDLNDIVAVGLDLKPKTLYQAYSQGIFPWPTEGLPLLWHSPMARGVIDFKDLIVKKRLLQFLKKTDWTYTLNEAFPEVIRACQERKEGGTWITKEMEEAYIEFHKLGYAHSVEVWSGNELIGGLYGVDVAGTFAGESTFHRKNNAGKAAILCTIAILKEVGRSFMDIQTLSPHMEAFGAKEISRSEFKKRLLAVQELEKKIGPSHPFVKRERFSYCNFSMFIE